MAEGVGQQGSLTGLQVTGTDTDASANGEARDSDGTQAATSIATFTLGTAGQNNHTYDFGFAACSFDAVVSVVTCNASGVPQFTITTSNETEVGAAGYSVSATGGVTVIPISAAYGVTTFTLSGATAGVTYTLTLTDSDDINCTQMVMITAPVIPTAAPASQTFCEDNFGTGISSMFNLGLLTDDVNSSFAEGNYTGGGLTLTYHNTSIDAMSGANPISMTAANNFTNTTPTQSAFARVVDGATGCFATAEITLIVENQPIANPQNPTICQGETINLVALEGSITSGNPAGTFVVSWFNDAALTSSVATPSNATVSSSGQVFYARVQFSAAPMCENVAPVTVTINPEPPATNTTDTVCEDETGVAVVQLTSYNTSVTGGASNTVVWYEDAALTTQVSNTNVSLSAAGNGTEANIFYAEISDSNGCTNTAILTLNVEDPPMIEAGTNQQICGGDIVFLTGAVLGTGLTSGTWSIFTQPVGGDAVLSSTAAQTNPSAVTFTASVPGDYILELTSDDPTGPCMAVSDQVRIVVSPRPLPPQNPQDAEYCDGETIPALSVGVANTSLVVDWYQDNMGTTAVVGATTAGTSQTQITLSATSTPAAPSAGNSVTIYARTRDTATGCESELLVPVTLTNNPIPGAPNGRNDAAYCADEPIPSISVDDPGAGFSIAWYSDPVANTPVTGAIQGGTNGQELTLTGSSNPSPPTPGNSVSLYAALVNTTTGCEGSPRTEVVLTQNPTPEANTAALVECETEFQSRQAVFDLSTLTDNVNSNIAEGTFSGGTVSLTYHLSQADATNDANPLTTAQAQSFTNTVLSAQTLYARVEDSSTGCFATTPIAVSVAGKPDADDTEIMLCEDTPGSNVASGVDLTALDGVVSAGNSMGSYVVNWFTDAGLTSPVATPTNTTVTGGSTLYAQIVFNAAPMCDNVAQVQVNLDPTPAQMDLNFDICEDSSGSAPVNLTDYESGITAGSSATVTWFEDAAFTMSVANTSLMLNAAGNGTEDNIFYAQITQGNCMNMAQLTFNVLEPPVVEAGPDVERCPPGFSDIILSGASVSNGATTGAWSIISQPAGGDGTLSTTAFVSNPSAVSFRASVAGLYTLQLTSDDPTGPCMASSDQMQVTILPLPADAINPQSAAYCEGEPVPTVSVEVTGTNNIVEWYQIPGTALAGGGTSVSGPNNEQITLSATTDPPAPTPGNSITLFALVINTATNCMSENYVPVVLTHNPAPAAPNGPQNAQYCAGESVPAIAVNDPGTGFSIAWYTDPTANTPVTGAVQSGNNGETLVLSATSNPTLPSPGNSVTVYAANVNDATSCESLTRVAVTLTQNPAPTASATQLVACENSFQSRQATFDLSTLTDNVNSAFPEGSYSGGGLTLTYHTSLSDADSDTNPLSMAAAASFVNTVLGAQTLYARVEDNATACFATAPVELSVAGIPSASNVTLNVCEDPSSGTTTVSGVDLTAEEDNIASVNGTGTYTIAWFSDAGLTTSVATPSNVTVSNGDIFYARVTFNTTPNCTNVGQLTVIVDDAPAQMDFTAAVCEDETGAANVDLTDYNSNVSSSSGTTVTWFEDMALTNPVASTNVTLDAANNGSEPNIFYADISDGTCTNPATLTINVSELPTVEAGAEKTICVGETVTLSDASYGAGISSGQWSIVSQPGGGNGSLSNTGVVASPNTVTFTASVAGDYTLQLTSQDPVGPCEAVNDQVRVVVQPEPTAAQNPQDAAYCDGETIPALSVSVSNASWEIVWYANAAGTTPVAAATVTGTNSEQIILTPTSTPPAPAAGSSTTVYAQVRNPITTCTSSTLIPVTLTNNLLPSAPTSPQNADYCTGEPVPAVGVADPGAGFSVNWYSTPTGNNPVTGAVQGGNNGETLTLNATSNPMAPSAGSSVNLYAALVNDATGCEGNVRTQVTLTHNPAVTANPAQLVACENSFQSRQATFNLGSLNDDVNPSFVTGVYGSVSLTLSYHLSQSDATNDINVISPASASAFMNTVLGAQTLYVRVDDGTTGCFATAEIALSVAGIPSATDVTLDVCDDPANPGMASGVDLTTEEDAIASGNGTGTYTVAWFSDAALTTAVPTPTNVVVADGQIFYAQLTFNAAPNCQNVGQLNINIQDAPNAMNDTVEICEDETGTANVNLADYNGNVTTSGGAVTWYEDAALTNAVGNTNVTVDFDDNGTEPNIFYAQISDGTCTNTAVLTFDVDELPTIEAGANKTICAGESVLLSDASASPAQWNVISQPGGGDGLLTGPLSPPNGISFTATVPGDYVLELQADPSGVCPAVTDQVTVTVFPLPTAAQNPQDAAFCDGETIPSLSVSVSNASWEVVWY
ncbi:MAG: hypothetical protein AAF738_01155, partial [Bacteroidota bacterium]